VQILPVVDETDIKAKTSNW